MKMPSTVITGLLLAASVLASCKDNNPADLSAPGTSFTITAADGCPDWAAGDSLSVLDNTGDHLFLAETAGRSVRFKGRSYASAKTRVFLSPYEKGLSFSTETLNFTVRQEQTAGRHISYAVSDGTSLEMTRLTEEIRLIITTEDVEYVSIKGLSGEPLSGSASVKLSDGCVSVTDNGSTLKLVPLKGRQYLSKGEHSLACLPGEISGLSLEVMHSGNRSCEKEVKGTLYCGVVDDENPWNHDTADISVVFITNPGESSLVWPFDTPKINEISSTSANASFRGQEVKCVLPVSEGGYEFTIFASNGLVKNSKNGLCIYGMEGDYIDLPVIPGLLLSSVTVVSGSESTSLQVVGRDGSAVHGGTVPSYFPSNGGSFTWNLYGAEIDKPYRLQLSSSNAYIQQIYLHYAGMPQVAPTGPVSPLDYGLAEAATGEERFDILYRTHLQALSEGREVDYTGLGTVSLTIPASAATIPLGPNTDFKGTRFQVLNNAKDVYLFSMRNGRSAVSVSGKQIDAADYSAVPELAKGVHIVAIEDQNAWVDNRTGYDYGATRREVVLVKDGVGSNGPVSPYDNSASNPSVWYCQTDESEKTFCNIILDRDPSCTKKTYLAYFDMQNNVHLSNIEINTPKSDLYGDSSIAFRYCTNVLLEDGIFEGNYSASNKYGYSISCNGTWNTIFRRLKSNCPWAVFGNNNTHKSLIENCDIERYDTHCYGRDITMRDCILNGKGLPVSSVFGDILLESCNFKDCYLYSMRSDYNSYVDFNIIVRDCEITPRTTCSIISMGKLDNVINTRPELSKKRWPNIDIDGLTVNIKADTDRLTLFYVPKNTYGEDLGHMSDVSIKGLKFKYASTSLKTPDFYISSVPVKVENDFKFSFSGSVLTSSYDNAKSKVYLNIHGKSDTIQVQDENIEFVNVK